jgi:hypothetical protein
VPVNEHDLLVKTKKMQSAKLHRKKSMRRKYTATIELITQATSSIMIKAYSYLAIWSSTQRQHHDDSITFTNEDNIIIAIQH